MRIAIVSENRYQEYYLAKTLLEKGHEVFYYDLLKNTLKDNQFIINDKNYDGDFSNDDLNLTDQDFFDKFNPIDTIFYFHNYESETWSPFQMKALGNHIIKNKVKEFFYISTGKVYGELNRPAIEMDILNPNCIKSSMIAASELTAMGLTRELGIKLWVARVCNVIGGKPQETIISDLKEKINSSLVDETIIINEANQQYIYITEFIEALMFIWLNSGNKVNIFNVAADNTVLTSDVYKTILKETKFSLEDYKLELKEDLNYELKCEKLNKLGFIVKSTSNEAVRKAIADIRS